MTRPTLLFDATILAYDLKKSSNRGGIFFVAYNILRKLTESRIFHISLYVRKYSDFHKMKKLGYLAPFDFIILIDKARCLFNIDVHKKQIQKNSNIFVKVLHLLQMIKNYLLIAWYHLLKYNDKQLKNICLFFSPVLAITEEITKQRHIKPFIMLHDAIPSMDSIPHQENAWSWFGKIIESLNPETYYFCISENTKNDFLKIAGNRLDKNKMMVTPIATAQNFYPNYDKAALGTALSKYGVSYNENTEYIFSFCTIDPRKNLLFTVGCFIKFIEKHNIQNLYFYLGGGHFEDFIEEFDEQFNAYSAYHDKIIRFGYVADEDVNILYSNSLFFTFLSQYEGFGMPPLEAMQAGTPVITSNNSSLPEVVGDAAITISYNDEAACIKAFEDLYFNKALREEYIAKGIERAKLFSWEKTVNMMTAKMLDAIKENDENTGYQS